MNQLQRIDVHGVTVRGREHERNHDHFAVASLNRSMRVHQTNLSIDDESRVLGRNQGRLFLVADGVSGQPAPAQASGAAVDSIVQYFLNDMPWSHVGDGRPAEVVQALEDALRNSQDDVMGLMARDRAGMGTTMTLAFLFWPDLYVAHVGDSRCYLVRDGELRQLTTDHTLAQVRREIGGVVNDRAENVLWNAIGGHDQRLHPEVRHLTVRPSETLALVTDGVSASIPADEMRSTLSRDWPAEEICEQLVRGAEADDRTAIVVRFAPPAHSVSPTRPRPARPSLGAMREQRQSKSVERVDRRVRGGFSATDATSAESRPCGNRCQ